MFRCMRNMALTLVGVCATPFPTLPRMCSLLIGTDCPALTATELRAAGLALAEGNDAVFIPAEDGGYVLIGLRRPIDSLFDGVPWGSDRVMDHTRESLRRVGLRWRELSPSWDVDRPEDADRLRASGLMPLPEGS